MRSAADCVIVIPFRPRCPLDIHSLEGACGTCGVSVRVIAATEAAAVLAAAPSAAAMLIAPAQWDELEVEQLIFAIRRSLPSILILCLFTSYGAQARLHRLARAGADDMFTLSSHGPFDDVARCVAQYAKHMIPRELGEDLVAAVPPLAQQLVSWACVMVGSQSEPMILQLTLVRIGKPCTCG